MTLPKSAFLTGFKRKEIEIEELGGSVIIRELSAADKTRISFYIVDDESDGSLSSVGDQLPEIIAAGLVRPKLTVKEVKQIPGDKSESLQVIAKEIMVLSGMIESENEEEVKNDEEG